MDGADKKAGKSAKGKSPMSKPRGKAAHAPSPDWTSGLKQLYDQVVDEPLPDALKDLLSKLDSAKR